MALTVKTRKILWSKSGNRCAICKKQLVQKIEINNSDFIVGEECHIISSKLTGPRGNVAQIEDFDHQNNLLLLCANDHKMIDDFPETFTREILQSLKTNHEHWIESAIENDLQEYIRNISNAEYLDEITNHTELDLVIRNSHFHFFDFSSILDPSLSIQIASFFDDLTDLSDIYSDIDKSSRTKYLVQHLNEINEFNKSGINLSSVSNA